MALRRGGSEPSSGGAGAADRTAGSCAARGLHGLRNPIQEYDWGSRRVLADLLGEPVPSARPQAELWIGAHPRAPSALDTADGGLPLPEAIAEAPEALLGPEVVRRFGPRLPFLLKVLAVERPLSLQAHPDAEQARQGFAREEASGIALDARERCYPDASAKPELVCALTELRVLKGFRSPAEIRERLEALEIPALADAAAALGEAPASEGLARLLRALLETPTPQRGPLGEAVRRSAARLRERDEAFAWTEELAGRHPDDPAAVAPLLLHTVRLRPGEALFLRARELHAYLEGAAVEVMASSDNVLRGGLTSKHVATDELLRVLDFADAPAEPFRPADRGAGERVFETPAAEFELAVLEPGGEGAAARGPCGPELWLCTEGSVELAPDAEGEPLQLARGQAGFVAARAPGYALRGRGVAWRVRVPSSR